MARLNLRAITSDATAAIASDVTGGIADADDNDDNDELPDLCTLLQRLSHQETRPSISKENGENNNHDGQDEKSVKRKQRPLRLAHVNSLLLLPVGRYGSADTDGGRRFGKEINDRRGDLGENTFAGEIKERMRNKIPARISISSSSASSERGGNITEGSSDDLSDFIVDDSASELDEDEVPRIRIPKEWKRTSPWKDGRAGAGGICSIPDGNHTKLKASPKKSISGHSVGGAGNFLKEAGAGLKFSPPQLDSLQTITNKENPMITPPSTPSRTKLLSPSKRFRIPPSPHRQSVDAFWNNKVVNEWNDKHSPTKELKIIQEKSVRSISDDDDLTPYSSIPPRTLPLSPSKRNQPEIQRRKMFNAKKHELASSFLHQLDQTITNGQISSLASSAGGIHIVWSNKLQSTAGRAHWKEEVIFSESPQGQRVKTGCHHHAKIELAEKIVINEDRLFNVLAHEFCHLATFMVSRIKHSPHGKEFKSWARKVAVAFSHLSICVTTKHSYDIAHKYIWACTSPQCRHEHKRQSKSIDPKRHACGKCRSPLVQIKPAPRATNAEGQNRAGRTAWQDYVKANMAQIREKHPGKSMKFWMEELGRGFREDLGKAREKEKEKEKEKERRETQLRIERNME